jgi:hypothetical protein
MGAGGGESKPRSKRQWTIFTVVPLGLIFAMAIGAVLLPSQPERRYSFIRADHPIDVGSDGNGRWFYYMPDAGGQTPAQLASTVRADLMAMGFVEDMTNRPWFRFANGGREVIVCNHDEIATMPRSLLGWRVIHQKPLPAAQRQRWPVIWVHEPGENTVAIIRFKFQKVVRGW